jgi:DNA polymerase-3 subunit delta
MKLAYQQLEQHLTKNLAPIYLVSSNEALLVQEAASLIRAAARKTGFTEHTLVTTDANAEWGKIIYTDTHSLSLLASKRIVELVMNSVKLNNANSKILEEYAQRPAADTLLIIRAEKLESKTEKSRWYQAIDKIGIVMPIWPINAEQLPQWLMQRAKKTNLTLTKAAADFLAAEVEGNLLAASQEIEKLNLLQTNTTIDEKIISESISDNARFDIFNLVDSALIGNSKRCVRILKNLEEEDVEPVLVLWALTRELRTLAEIAKQQAQGNPIGSLFSKYRIWEKRQPAVRAFLQRNQQKSCWSLLASASSIDLIIKGAEPGNVWDALQDLTLRMAK